MQETDYREREELVRCIEREGVFVYGFSPDPYEAKRIILTALRNPPVNSNRAMHVALLEIEQISDCCINAEHYTAEEALRDLQEIRCAIKRAAQR